MLSIVKEIDAFDLRAVLWGGALDRLEIIIEKDKLQELMGLLEDMYPEPVGITTVNDLLWFADDFVFEHLGIDLDDECTYSNGPVLTKNKLNEDGAGYIAN